MYSDHTMLLIRVRSWKFPRGRGPARGQYLRAGAASVVVPDGWKAMANVLHDAMSPQTISLRCPSRGAPEVGPKNGDVDERHQARRSEAMIRRIKVSRRGEQTAAVRAERIGTDAPRPNHS